MPGIKYINILAAAVAIAPEIRLSDFLKLVIFCTTTLAMLSSAAWASQAGDLLASCESPSGTPGDGYCNSWINGFVNGIQMDQILNESKTPVCIDHTDTKTARTEIVNFLRTAPVIHNVDAGSAVGYALQKLHPCR
jgi:hypothetical protein